MSGSVAIETNREALVRIVASLVAMAAFTSPLAGEDGSVRRGKAEPPAEPGEGALSGVRPTITRHVWRAILSLLRPAESAARRLIIAAARGIVIPPPKPRKPAPRFKPAPLTARTLPQPADREAFLRRFGIAITGTPPPPRFTRSPSPVCGGGVADSSAVAQRAKAEGDGGGILAVPRIPAFPLFDPPRRLRLKPPRRYVPAHAAPRIMFPGITRPHRLPPPPPPPLPDDLISAAGVARRLAALAAALDDLPKQARRFARWQARLKARRSQEKETSAAQPCRFRRTYPLRGGPPYGGRLAVWDPTVPLGKHIREVDVILAHAHALADYALAFPDTS